MNTMKSDFKQFPSISKRPILSGGMFGKSPVLREAIHSRGKQGNSIFHALKHGMQARGDAVRTLGSVICWFERIRTSVTYMKQNNQGVCAPPARNILKMPG